MAGGAISRRSKKQESTAQSTLEAEFVVMSHAVREAVWLPRLIEECIPSSSGLPATVVFGDNEGAMNLAYNDVVNERSKHIAVKYFFSKEKFKDGTIVFNHIPTSENAADVFTKILPAATHKEMVLKLSMTRS